MHCLQISVQYECVCKSPVIQNHSGDGCFLRVTGRLTLCASLLDQVMRLPAPVPELTAAINDYKRFSGWLLNGPIPQRYKNTSIPGTFYGVLGLHVSQRAPRLLYIKTTGLNDHFHCLHNFKLICYVGTISDWDILSCVGCSQTNFLGLCFFQLNSCGFSISNQFLFFAQKKFKRILAWYVFQPKSCVCQTKCLCLYNFACRILNRSFTFVRFPIHYCVIQLSIGFLFVQAFVYVQLPT